MESTPSHLLQGSNPVKYQGSNPEEGSNLSQGSNPDEFQDSNLEEGSNPNYEQGSNPDSASQSSNSDDDEDESTRKPSNLGLAIQAIEGDSEIYIRLPLPMPSPIIKRSSVATDESIMYTREQWEQLHQHRLIPSTNRSNDLGAVEPSNEFIINESNKMSSPSLPKHVIQTKTVSNKRRQTTPQHIIDAIKENCIYQGAGKRRQLDVMYTHLESTNLLSLLLGYRRQPIIDPDLSKGDTGYTRQRIILKEQVKYTSDSNVSTTMSSSTFTEPSEPTYITIPEDDIFLFNYDKARLMVLVKEMFHKSYSAHGERGAKNGDPVQYYNDMMSYIFGNTIIDINASENAINNFRINRSNKFAEECVRWERLFEDYQFARNNKPLEEERKLGFLMKHVYDDPRTPWHSTMNHCNLTNMTYDQTIQMLHHACQTTPESMQTVKMYM